MKRCNPFKALPPNSFAVLRSTNASLLVLVNHQTGQLATALDYLVQPGMGMTRHYPVCL